MKVLGIIPARYGSTRLEGKPLVDICGKPMLQRVYEQAKKSSMDRVIIATDDQRIYNKMTELGCEICMTSSEHRSGTDRLAEVVTKLQLADDDIVVNENDSGRFPEVNDGCEVFISGNEIFIDGYISRSNL